MRRVAWEPPGFETREEGSMWSKRALKRTTSTAVIRSWRHSSGRARVAEVKSLLGLGTRYLFIRILENGNEEPMSNHRRKSAAMKSAEKSLGCK